jgi:Tfp pilus assembly protein PilF
VRINRRVFVFTALASSFVHLAPAQQNALSTEPWRTPLVGNCSNLASTVSVTQLKGNASAKAARELLRSLKAQNQGDLSRAVEYVQRALQLAPAFMEAHNNLGVLWAAQEKYEAALEEFRTAHNLEPHCGTVAFNLSTTLLFLHRDREAQVWVRRALDLDPANAEARSILANLQVTGR